jgi:hypothetical protein
VGRPGCEPGGQCQQASHPGILSGSERSIWIFIAWGNYRDCGRVRTGVGTVLATERVDEVDGELAERLPFA